MKKLICVLLLLSLLVLPVHADAVTEIYTPQELADVAKNPSGTYVLMEDLDMTGVEWKSLDFSGSFDGNGHSILNLTIVQPGDKKLDSYDGNSKTYATTYFGLFGVLENAQVSNLSLVNVRAVITCDDPCYLGGIAGGMKDSEISECSVSGVLELRAHKDCFGIGGLVGFGSGRIEKCQSDVTLICTDTDAATKDEQFMGGLYANGAIEMFDCTAQIDGYISEHGYVHSGAMIGMFMREPNSDVQKTLEVQNNVANGRITFFEDNTDRRAYCKGDVGEVLGYNYRMIGNVAPHFERNEQYGWDVTKEIRPEMCENPSLTETVVPCTCEEFGYTQTVCAGCGYTQRDHYTLKAHNFGQWITLEEPTEEHAGQVVRKCMLCGFAEREEIPQLVLETEPPVTEPEIAPAAMAQVTEKNWLLTAAAGCIVLSLVLLGAAVYFYQKED